MTRDDGKRNFALREEDGSESSVFSGRTPRQAALKAARRLPTAPSKEEVDGSATLRLREKGTKKVHVYEGWAWIEQADENSPEWLSGTYTEANVSKQSIEHLD